MGALDNLKKAILQNPSGGMSTPGMTPEQSSAPAQVNTPKPAQTNKPLTGLTNNKPQSSFMRTMADTSGITLPTITPAQQANATRIAASANPAAQSRINEPITKVVKAVDTAATKQGLKSQSLPDMFGTLSKRTGSNGDIPSSYITARTQVREAGDRLNQFYTQKIAPAYQTFKQAEADYRAGKITLEEYSDAQNNYRNLYNVYQPQQSAWETLSRYDNDTYWNNADLTEAAESLGLYDYALAEGNLKLTDMQAKFDELKKSYDLAEFTYNGALTRVQAAQKALDIAQKAYKGGKSSPEKYQATLKAYQDAVAEFETSRANLIKAGNSVSELEGQYDAAQMYLETMAGVAKYGADTYKKRFTDAHPDVVWQEDRDRWNAAIGLSDEENNTDFMSIIHRIDELKTDNPDGKNDNEIAHYYAVLNSGLAYANMTAESAANARKFFNDRVATYEQALEAFNDLTDIETFINSGGILPPEEMAAYEARKAQRDELRSRRAEALNWISKIETREYEMTYDEVIKGLSIESQDLIEDYIHEVADPSEQVREQLIASANGSFGDYQALRTNTPLAAYSTGINLAGALTDTTMNREELTEALRADGLADEQIKGILYYVNYEANARRAERISESMYEASSGEGNFWINTIVNNINQVMLGMGNGLGAIENLAQYAVRPFSKRERNPGEDGANPTFRQVSPDPYFHKRAPVDYNSFSNLGTIATRAINEGEAELIRKLFVDENTPEAEQLIQQKRAQFWTNVYGLATSMEQSVLIQLLGGMGMKESLWLLSGQAAANTMQDMHEKGYSDDSIILGGIVSGFAEYITEKISLEGVLNRFQSGITTGMSANEMAKALGKNVLLQALSEGSEEVASNLVNTLYDETIGRLLNGGLSQIEVDALALQQQNPSMKWDEAYKSAFGEWVKSVRDDFIGGFASGGLMGGGAYGIGYAAGTHSARKTGQQIINAGNDYALFQAARNVIDTVAAKTAGADASVGTDTAIRAGRLLNYLTGEEYNTYRVVEARLKALNETEGNITPELLRAIVDTATGQHLTPAERAAFSASQFGQQVANELEEYKAEMDRSRENQMDPYLNENTEWAQGAFETDELARAAYLGTNQGDIVTALGANEMELRYRQAQENNPDASVLTPTSKQITDAGMSAEIADKQGKLLDKVFSGQYLSAKEMRSLDFNNTAVRKVFVERTGMTGIPDGNVSDSLKRTYVNEAARQSARVVQNQQAIKAGLDALTEVREEQSKERTEAMKNASKKTRNPILRLIEGTTGRRFNTEKRQQAAQEEYESRKRETARSKEIPTEGRTPFQIINQVRIQSGEPKLLGRAAFVQNAEQAGVDVSDSVAVDNAYTMYLREAGLTNAEVNAMLEAARMGEQRKAEAKAKAEAAEAEKGNANGIQRGNEGRVSESNGRRGAGGVREDSSAQVKNSKDIGIPGGAEEGQLTEVSAEDVQNTPELRNALDYLEQNGIKAENVHFVVSADNDFIYISKAGRDIPVRGVYDPDTQSVWILANDSSNAQLSPEQIAAHEVFHHYIKTHPGLFEAIVNRLEADGLYDLAVEAAQKYAGGTKAYDTNSIGPYLEEVMADAHADINTITGADARQFNKLVKELTGQALQSEATHVTPERTAEVIDHLTKASAIEIPDSAKTSHYDNLGRKLSKKMDAFMKNSFMREGLEEFVENGVVPEGPLMVMYQGGRLGFLTFPDGRMTFWSDRPEVARTYSMGKYSDEISTTHVQEHTKLRQRIRELESEYDDARYEALHNPSPETKAEFERIRQELLAAHREIEPFSKDIYTPSKDRDVFPHKPQTVEDAIKLIERYGYNNRAAKIVDTEFTPEQAVSSLADPIIYPALQDVKDLSRWLMRFTSELEEAIEGTDEEEISGTPPWMLEDSEDTESNDELKDIHDVAVDAMQILADVLDAYADFDFGNHTAEDVYDLLEELSGIDADTIDDLIKVARGDAGGFFPSYELYDDVDYYLRSLQTNWDDITGVTRAVYDAMNQGSSKARGLEVKGQGVQKIFNSDADIIDYATSLARSTGFRGIYSCYLNLTHPLVIDCKGLPYSDLDSLDDNEFPFKDAVLQYKYGMDYDPMFSSIRSRDIANWASAVTKEDGNLEYDGVILLNVIDTYGAYGDTTIRGDKTSTVAITWNANTPKSTANTDPTDDSRITYSAVDDTNAAVQKALEEFEPSPNRSPELNDLIRRLAFENESVTLDEMMTVPEIAAAEANSTRGKKVEKLPEWDAELKAAKSNFLNLGSYNSEAEGKGIQKWTGPVDKGKTAVIVLGPPAAGKSTIAVNELSEFIRGRITDKDEYRPFFTGNKNGEDASFVEKPSSDMRKEMYKAITANGENFVWPTVGRGVYEEWFQNELRKLKEKGYTVYLAYVNVDRNNSMARSLVRSFPSDGSKARYTNIAYAEEGAIEPRINYEAAKNDTFTDTNGNTMPMVDGYVMFDNSVLGRNAILVENTIPGFREETQKGETYGAQQRELRGNGESTRAEPGVGGQGVRNLSELGRHSVDSVRDGRVVPDSGRGRPSQLGNGLQELGLADGPNVSELIRADEAEAETQRKNELLSQAKASAVQTIKKANAVSVSSTEKTTNGVNYDHSKSFAEQVDDYRAYYDGKNKKAWHVTDNHEDFLVIGETPQVLHDLGFIDLPLTYPPGHMARILKIWNELERQRAQGVKEEDLVIPRGPGWQANDWDHAFGPEVLKQLPDAIKDPVAIIRSEKAPAETITVYTELYDIGKPIRAFVEIEGTAQDNGREIDSYLVKSVHRSEWADQVLNAALDSELKGNVIGVYYLNEDKLLNVPGIDREKVARLSKDKHQRLERTEYTGDLLHRITEEKAEVKPKITDNTNTRQFKHWFKGSLKSDSGEPRVVYHVTDSDQATKKGLGYRVTFSPEEGAREVYGRLTRAIYLPGALTTNADGVLRQMAQADFDQAFKRLPETTREKIRAELPGVLNSISRIGSTDKANEELLQYLKKYRIDGIRFKGGEFLLFDPNQIKAVDNIGLYSTNSDNMRYSAVEAKAEKKRKAKLKAAENAKIDKEWAVGLAQSDGEQRLKAAQRFWQDKFDYATRTDIEWAKGMKESERRAGKAETKRRTREAIALDRAIRSLPATAAAKNRRAVRRADAVEINDDQAVLTPLPLPDDTAVKLPRSATEFGNLFKKGFDKFYRAMVNAVQEVDRFAKLQTRTDDMSVWVNIVRSARSTVERFYTDAMLDQQGNAIGPSMEKTFLCFDENGKFDQQLQNALNDYMFHLHNIDRMSLKSRAIDRVKAFEAQHEWLAELSDKDFQKLVANKVPLAIEYAQLLKEAAEAEDKPVLADADGNPVTAETSRKVVEVYENDMPWLKDKAQEIYDWWDVFMREWAVGTSITEEQYEHMREIYPHYVPTYRVDKGQHAGYISHTQTALSSGEMVKRATGSLKPLQAMEDQFVKSMTQIVTNNRKNGFLRNLVEELLFDDEGKFSQYGVFDWRSADPALKQSLWEFADETEETAVEKVKVDGQEAYRVSCWVDGVKMSAYVNRAMFEGIQFLFGIHSDAYNKAANLGRKITQPMKNMITGYNPTFAIKNIIRDQHTALTNSHAGIAYWKYLGQAAAKIAENDSDWVNFQALGGVSANETRVDGGFAQAMHPATGVKKAWQTGKEILGKPGEISESMSRFAEYLAMLDILGGDSIENRMAAIRASAEVTVDFGRSGSLGRLINMWVPYWNANVQGLDKAIRNIAEQPDIKSMLRRTSRAVLVNLIPAALQAALIGALKRWKDYEELSDQQKDNYYCIPVPGKEHKFLKIPKSQDWAAFISTPFLRFWEGVEGRDDPMEGWFESAVLPQLPFDMRDIGLGVEMPVLMPIFLDDLFDLASNKNWAGSAIIPYNLQKASPREQFDADTSLLAYYFGQMFNASPMAIDYLIDNYMGNFWGIAAKTVPLTPLVSRGIVSGETKFSDRAIDAVTTVSSPFLSDNRYSNSALSNYYDMLNTLEQEVIDAGVHGDKTEAEHYHIYQALTQAGGYVDQIRTLTAEAKTLPKGEAQANLRWEAAGLADLALEFVQKCIDGEIEDPELWMTYAPYGENILREAESLRELESSNGGGFNFSGKLGNPGIIYDRSGDIDLKYDLTSIEGAQQEYKRLRSEEYQNAINKVINDRNYQNLSPEEKAARLEQARSAALKNADKKMLEYLKYNNVKGEQVGKKDYDAERRAAAYSVSWLLGDSSAYKPELTNQFLDLYDYNDQYSFIPADTARKTFKDPSDNSKVFVLDSAQQNQYSRIYHDTITEVYSDVIGSQEFTAASNELRAAMLAKAKTFANDEIKERFAEYLRKTGAEATAVEKASSEISLEAKYAVQRMLGDSHAMQKSVTDELVRLYQYSDVGEVEYFPITTAPKTYVDDRDKDYMWVLTEKQREMYMSIMFDTYQKNILRVMNSSQYKSANDYGKAQLLCDVRSRLSGEVQAEFKHWLRTSGAKRTYRKNAEAQAAEADIAAAGKIVDSILGKARTYKQFNEARGY